MTFVQNYSLSVDVPKSYFRAKNQCLSSVCTKALFQNYLSGLDVVALQRYHKQLGLDSESDAASPTVQEISDKLSKLTYVSDYNLTTRFDFQIKKNDFWVKEIQKVLLTSGEFKNTITRHDLEKITQWKTDYQTLLLFFLAVFIASCVIANAISSRVIEESAV